MPKNKASEPQTAPAKKAAPTKSAPKRKNTKHVDVPNEVVLKALDKLPMSMRELVPACGGDPVAVKTTIQRLRGLGQVVAEGTSRNTLYRKA